MSAPRLPTPGLDMEGETAARFIEDVAELYTGVDRWHVRRLAALMRKPEPEPGEPPLTLADLRGLSSECDAAACDARSAASALEDAGHAIDRAIKVVEAKAKARS